MLWYPWLPMIIVTSVMRVWYGTGALAKRDPAWLRRLAGVATWKCLGYDPDFVLFVEMNGRLVVVVVATHSDVIGTGTYTGYSHLLIIAHLPPPTSRRTLDHRRLNLELGANHTTWLSCFLSLQQS